MVVKASQIAHFGKITPRIDFEQAFTLALQNPLALYYTTGNQSVFLISAQIAKKGVRKGERVIVFKNNEGKESARAYECCWNHITNCNRTYIDCYILAL